jgi:hypothetical protein
VEVEIDFTGTAVASPSWGPGVTEPTLRGGIRGSDGDAAVGSEGSFDLPVVDLAIFGLGGPGTVANLPSRQPAPVIAVLWIPTPSICAMPPS